MTDVPGSVPMDERELIAKLAVLDALMRIRIHLAQGATLDRALGRTIDDIAEQRPRWAIEEIKLKG